MQYEAKTDCLGITILCPKNDMITRGLLFQRKYNWYIYVIAYFLTFLTITYI